MGKADFKYALPVGALLRSPDREYRVEEVLGVGGFGITYKVSTTLVYQNVPIFTYFAVKEHFLKGACERGEGSAEVVCPRPSKKRVEESRKDFVSEAERLRALSGQVDNIVPVCEVFEANNTAYYVMEYLNGGTLDELVKAVGPLSAQRALEIIEPVARAVAFLHGHRINHLDIKPDNIMFKTTPDGLKIPVIIDFGLARLYDSSGCPASTVRVQGCSDGYAPVEQYAGLNTFVPQADVYALGATLYYMLVGKEPAIATEQTSAGIVRSLPKTLDRRLVNAIVGAMQQSCADRAPSVEAFLASLHDGGEDVCASGSDTAPTRVITARRKSRKALWIVLASVAAAIAVAATVMFMMSKKEYSYGLRDGEYEYIDEFGWKACDSVAADNDAVYYDTMVEDTVAAVCYDDELLVDSVAEW